MQIHRPQFIALVSLVMIFIISGCATSPKVTPEMSEQIRQMAEMRDTCTQYAAWVARDYPSTAPEYKKAQQLYIEASASANSYIEALQFTVLSGGSFSSEKNETAAQRVHDSGKAFLDYAREAVGVPKTRFLPLVIPLAGSLVDLGNKVSSSVKSANQQQRELIAKSIGDKKWKPFNELTRP
ncbi:MAG TPA: hypothetical protein PKA41_01860 [Verrucomicrobiota bacterium]|nr:hypothetical protein [Verrucomicrobiota bacterium]